MNTSVQTLFKPRTLNLEGALAYAVEGLFIAAAVLFPMVAHAQGWPVFALLPMHWTILLAGMVYGWKAGLIAGISAPLLSFAFTGMPAPFVLPMILIEVGLYGFVSGLLREKSSLNTFLILGLTLLIGRIGFLASALALGKIQTSLFSFIQSSFSAGVAAAVLQILLLPFLTAALTRSLKPGLEE